MIQSRNNIQALRSFLFFLILSPSLLLFFNLPLIHCSSSWMLMTIMIKQTWLAYLVSLFPVQCSFILLSRFASRFLVCLINFTSPLIFAQGQVGRAKMQNVNVSSCLLTHSPILHQLFIAYFVVKSSVGFVSLAVNET